MITKFKIFESINEGVPKIGDFVIINEVADDFYSDDALNFINNSIGNIFKKAGDHSFLIKFFGIPKEMQIYFQYSDFSDGLKIGNSVLVSIKNVKYWSKSVEELEYILKGNKYNL